METTAQKAIKVIAIILICGAALGILLSFGVFGTAAMIASYGGDSGGVVAAGFFSLIAAAVQLAIGIFCVRNYRDPYQAPKIFTNAVITVVIAAFSAIVALATGSFSFGTLIGFALPIIFLVYANKLKAEAMNPVAPVQAPNAQVPAPNGPAAPPAPAQIQNGPAAPPVIAAPPATPQLPAAPATSAAPVVPPISSPAPVMQNRPVAGKARPVTPGMELQSDYS